MPNENSESVFNRFITDALIKYGQTTYYVFRFKHGKKMGMYWAGGKKYSHTWRPSYPWTETEEQAKRLAPEPDMDIVRLDIGMMAQSEEIDDKKALAELMDRMNLAQPEEGFDTIDYG